ncbi:hypothetical protein QK908_12280 [Lactococcus cremoris]
MSALVFSDPNQRQKLSNLQDGLFVKNYMLDGPADKRAGEKLSVTKLTQKSNQKNRQ